MANPRDESPVRVTVIVAVPLPPEKYDLARNETVVPAASQTGPVPVTRTDCAFAPNGVCGRLACPAGVKLTDPPVEDMPLFITITAVPTPGSVSVIVYVVASSVIVAWTFVPPASFAWI